MLLDLRDGIRNSKWLKYVLVGIICVPFALVGINSYFGNHGPDYAAKVNGEKIPYNSFQNAYSQARNQIAQSFGGRLPQGLNLGSMVNNQAMDTVVRQEVLRQSVAGNGFAVGDDDLAQQLVAVESFSVDGAFDKELYSRQLQSMGVSPAQFEEQFRTDLLLNQFRQGVVSSGFALKDENEALQALRDQKRAVSTIALNTQAKAETIEVSDEEVSAYYDANTASFNNPEKVKVEYIEVKTDDVKETLEVSDEDLEAYFEQNKSQWVAPERRAASHILLAVDRDASSSDIEEKQTLANEIVARIAAGETLASIAPTVSDDPGSADNGGSLGEFGRGVMVPEFEDMAYAMEIGEVSEPVRSDFGFHIIQLDNIIGEQGQSFADVKDEVKDQYLTEQAETQYSESSTLLANASYENNDSLQPAADESGFEIKTSDWIDRNSTEGIAAFPQVLNAALTEEVLNNGSNSEVLEVGENHAIVLRTIEHEEAQPKPVDEVREDIVQLVQTEKATEELDSLADTLIADLEGGAAADALATEHGGEFTETASVGRNEAERDRAMLQKLFTMPKPEAGAARYDKVTTSDGNIVVVAFSGIDTEVAATDESAESAAEAVPTSVPALAEFDALVRAIEGDADIERNEQLLQTPEYQ